VAQTKAFMEGHEAKNNTADQVACIDELLWLIQKHPRLTENEKELPFVIAVDRWSLALATMCRRQLAGRTPERSRSTPSTLPPQNFRGDHSILPYPPIWARRPAVMLWLETYPPM
jgi:hypothetical protein